ncbi:hypothetical protein A1O3_06991 [Capronia epimyces CBS 606.96]|uniref:NACHT-NTPase and P-loop NTPases N-terminal domain-containing protein n=1 Tax=Capronia epimyces CBS 606.96 TaxID=1182542 RepID=W9XJL1_9EURO|nr:uncharacterized protein A1O3_06991 [Capronia epimyces CBS 606.96]EXJ80707.1 hypothetical protein A1O3_06991 [Capronia epimyces CBS 606.96]
MAEAAAIIGLVASISSLIDLSSRVVSRLHEFTTRTSDIPESFRALSIRLPLLTATLERISFRTESDRLPQDVTQALKAVVDNTSEQVAVIQTCVSKIVPPVGASKVDRALKALKGLAKEEKMQQALEKIHKNIDTILLHQTTQQIDTSDRILQELSKVNLAPTTSSSGSEALDGFSQAHGHRNHVQILDAGQNILERMDVLQSAWEARGNHTDSTLTSINLNVGLQEQTLQNVVSTHRTDNDRIIAAIQQSCAQSALAGEQQRQAQTIQYDALKSALDAILGSLNRANTISKSSEDDIRALGTGIERLRVDVETGLHLQDKSTHQTALETRERSPLSDQNFLDGLRRLLEISTNGEGSIDPSEAKASIRNLVTILDQIAAIDSTVMSSHTEIAQDYVFHEINRTKSIFQVAPELQMATTQGDPTRTSLSISCR